MAANIFAAADCLMDGNNQGYAWPPLPTQRDAEIQWRSPESVVHGRAVPEQRALANIRGASMDASDL